MGRGGLSQFGGDVLAQSLLQGARLLSASWLSDSTVGTQKYKGWNDPIEPTAVLCRKHNKGHTIEGGCVRRGEQRGVVLNKWPRHAGR